MDRAGKKVRDISYHSPKNGGMVVVHSEAARAYSKYLEERPEVASYEACKPLDGTRLNSIQKTDIRGEYFKAQWTSDFCIRFTDGTTVNIEELIKLDPDVVFYGASNPEIGEQLKNSGIPGIAISVNKWDYNAIETLDNWISLISEMFPDNDKTQLVSDYSNEVYDEIQERVADMSDEDRARLFFLFQYSDTTIATSGQNFFGQWWADAIGAVNVAQELTTDNANQVSMEQIYGWNPDTILITNFNQATPDDLFGNTIGSYDWSEIDAIKLGQVYKMPLGMYRSYTPGVDTPITLYWLAKTVYPELFEDIDVTEKTIDYYDSVFGVQLTEEQAESIFTPVTAAGEVYFD